MKKRSIVVTSLGTIVTGLVFLFLIPTLMNDFGIERFGYISLMIILLSVASIFDAGVARGLTHTVASNSEGRENLQFVWPVIYILMIWGSALGGLFYFLLKLYFNNSLGIPDSLLTELNDAAFYLGLTVPFVILHAALRGILEGLEKFSLVSFSKITAGIVIAALLFANSLFSATLVYVAISLLVARIVGIMVILGFVIKRIKPSFGFRNDKIAAVLKFGGWASLSTVGSSAAIYLDRFVAGYYVSAVIYGSYSVISDVTMRFLFIPGAIGVVLFPMISKFKGSGLSGHIYKAYSYLLLVMVPILVILYFFGFELFSLWLSHKIDENLFDEIIIVLLIGLLLNSLTHIPYAVIQGLGYVKITAIIHITELCIFVPMLILLAMSFGLNGVLYGWLFRVTADFLIMSYFQVKLVKRRAES